MKQFIVKFNKLLCNMKSPKMVFNLIKTAGVLIFIVFIFSFLAINVGNSMSNNPKEAEYNLINQELEQINQEYINALPSLKNEKLAELATKSAVRKQKLLAELQTDPELFLKNARLGKDRSRYPDEIRNNIEENFEIEGKLNVIIMDQPNQAPKYEFILETSNGNYKLNPTNKPKIKPNSMVRVKGIKLDNQIAYSPDDPNTNLIVLSLPGEIKISNAKVAVILFKFTNTTSEPFTKGDVDYKFLGAPNSVKNYYLENSMNQMTFSSTTFGWYQISYDNSSSCDWPTWTDAVDQLMANQGVNLIGYNYKYYIFPQTSGCPSSAWSYLGGDKSWSNNDIDSRTLGHELGHNFGNNHANSLDCGTKAIDVQSNCTSTEYGDIYDLMGNYWWMQNSVHFNSAHKLSVGWIPTSKVQTITSNGNYTVNSVENIQTGPQALKIRKNDTNEFYYISKKQNVGFDQEIPTSITDGALIHVWDESNYSQTKLLDTTPGSVSDAQLDFADASLKDGREFYDQINNITVRQISHTDSTVTVQVTLPQTVTPTPTPTVPPTPTPTPTPGIQLIKNPGFEKDANSDNHPDAWSDNPNFSRSMITAYSGSFSGKHFSTKNVNYNVNQVISNIIAGTTYTFSGWVKIPATTDGNFNLIITIKWRNSKDAIISTSTIKNYSSSTSGWNNALKNITAPAGAKSAIINMQVKSLNAAVYVDDFSFKSI
jgi:hypothetical protein